MNTCCDCGKWKPDTGNRDTAAAGRCSERDRLTNWGSTCDKFQDVMIARMKDADAVMKKADTKGVTP